MDSALPRIGQALQCVSETSFGSRQRQGRDQTGELQERIGEDSERWREEKRHRRKRVAEKLDRPLTKQIPGTLSVRRVSALIN